MNFIPTDIEAMNWMWSVDSYSDENLMKHGLYTVYGNFNALGMKNFDERIAKVFKASATPTGEETISRRFKERERL